MADIATTTFGIGDPVPPFSLPDTDGVAHAVPQADPAPSATVLVVSCCHCPYVIAWNPRLRRVAEEYGERGVRFLGINANDASRYPADSPDAMRRFVRDPAGRPRPGVAQHVLEREARGRAGVGEGQPRHLTEHPRGRVSASGGAEPASAASSAPRSHSPSACPEPGAPR